MEIDIVGEDFVTQAIIERLIKDFRPDLIVRNRLPVRGGQIKSMAPKFNLLKSAVFLLTDLDQYECPPSLLKDWFGDESINNRLLFRVACEEAETWLMADRKGFAKWLAVDIELIPLPREIDRRRKEIIEIIFPLKPSLFMMMKIASQSKNEILKTNLTPKNGASKGPEYNSAMISFIEKKWDVKAAAKNSYSLTKAIVRLVEY